AAVAVAIKGCRIAARPAIALARDEVDERCFLGLLHVVPLPVADGALGPRGDSVIRGGRRAGGRGGRVRRWGVHEAGVRPCSVDLAQYMWSIPARQGVDPGFARFRGGN